MLEDVFSTNTFLTGEQITIADTIAYAFFSIQETTSVSTADYANITRWYDAMKARPGIQRAGAYFPGT